MNVQFQMRGTKQNQMLIDTFVKSKLMRLTSQYHKYLFVLI